MLKDYPSLTAMVHLAVKDAQKHGSGLDALTIADLVGKPYATLMSELSRQPGHKLGADLVLPLMEASGLGEMVAKFFCRQAGGSFVMLPEAANCNAGLVQTLAASVREFGEFATETAQSISDGDIPKDQLDRIIKEGNEAVEAIMAMLKLARITHEKQYGQER